MSPDTPTGPLALLFFDIDAKKTFKNIIKTLKNVKNVTKKTNVCKR